MMKLSHNPALQERPEGINAGGVDFAAHVFALTVAHGFMWIAGIFQKPVAAMLVSGDKRNILGHRRAHESIKCAGVSVLNHFGNDHALTSNRADHGNFACGAASKFKALALVSIFLSAADKSL